MKLTQTSIYISLIAGSILTISTSTKPAQAAAINPPLQVTIQPIQVCDNAGANCANAGTKLFSAETKKIWAQAGITINFLGFNQFNSTNFQVIDMAGEFNNLVTGAGHGQNANNMILNMWFVKTINNCGGIAAFGCALTPGNGIAIDDDTFSFNGGVGRLDTIAHEIGHNLGLDHNTFGAGGAKNLMTANGRTIPGSINDITPNGAMLDQLTMDQITEARKSMFAKPIPEPLTVLGSAIAVGWGVVFKKKLAKKQKNRK